MSEEEVRDGMQMWCDKHGHYELAQRLAFVPLDVMKKLVGKSKEQAEAVLEANGY